MHHALFRRVRSNSGSKTISQIRLSRPHAGFEFAAADRRLIKSLSSGGDARIKLQAETGLNIYLSGPYPRDVIAYSSSTVSDISPAAFDHLRDLGPEQSDYAQNDYAHWLANLALRIKTAFQIGQHAEVVFAPSGTDLEYVSLAAVTGLGAGGVHNILLGADEIGSGCVHSARARYFARETALGNLVSAGQDVPGFGDVSMIDVPVRCGAGQRRSSAEITHDMIREIESAQRAGKHSLVHGVHGSKTGLVLPGLSDIEAMKTRFGDDVTFVIDACQARITQPAIAGYLARGAIVLMTGSKFVGAPPFNGWALVPPALIDRARDLPKGLSTIFRSAEWPKRWPGAEILPDTDNLSLALRLEAAVFELERFQRIEMERVTAIIAEFEAAVTHCLIEKLPAKRVCPGGAGADLPIEMRTLVTLDVSQMPGLATFDEAKAVHAKLALDGIRLGQPVKCVALDDNRGWGGTLRLGLSMPMITNWAEQPIEQVRSSLEQDMARIAHAIKAAVA